MTTPTEKRRAAHLRRVYDISMDQYQALLDLQGGVCAVCGKPPKTGRNLQVDHEHGGGRGGSGGFCRGLLCGTCNLRIVGRHKSGELLRAAANYLDDPPARYVLPKNHSVPKRKRRPRKRPRKTTQ